MKTIVILSAVSSALAVTSKHQHTHMHTHKSKHKVTYGHGAPPEGHDLPHGHGGPPPFLHHLFGGHGPHFFGPGPHGGPPPGAPDAEFEIHFAPLPSGPHGSGPRLGPGGMMSMMDMLSVFPAIGDHDGRTIFIWTSIF